MGGESIVSWEKRKSKSGKVPNISASGVGTCHVPTGNLHQKNHGNVPSERETEGKTVDPESERSHKMRNARIGNAVITWQWLVNFWLRGLSTAGFSKQRLGFRNGDGKKRKDTPRSGKLSIKKKVT